jgi:hypothetical protein
MFLVTKHQVDLLIIPFSASIVDSIVCYSLLELSLKPLDKLPVVLILSLR